MPRFAALLWLGILPGAMVCQAGELVCLKSGFCLHAQSYAQKDGRLALQLGTGSIEVAVGDVASIEETHDDPPPLPPQKVAGPGTAPAPAPRDPQILVRTAADAQGVDTDFVRSVAWAESGFIPQALSPKGALGLMQLMPATARDLSVDPLQPAENALGGAKYLRELLLRYHGNSALALAAYNAGPAAVDRYHGVPPYAETRQYIRRVTREYDRLQAAASTRKAVVSKTSTKKQAVTVAVNRHPVNAQEDASNPRP